MSVGRLSSFVSGPERGQSKCKLRMVFKTSRRLHVEHKRSSLAPVFEALGRQSFRVPEATVHAVCDMEVGLYQAPILTVEGASVATKLAQSNGYWCKETSLNILGYK